MNLIILGGNSEIAQSLEPFFLEDGWQIQKWDRTSNIRYFDRWDLVLVAIGQVAPVGLWWDVPAHEFEECVNSNVLLPVRLLRQMWINRNPGASVCFMAGSNPNKPMKGYSAYNCGKMALLKVCEQLDFESPDCKFFALAPGYVPTKIHKATLDKGWKNERIEKGGGTPISKIYDCLKWSLKQPKDIIGGRNICVSDPYGPRLAKQLKDDPSTYKLRRVE